MRSILGGAQGGMISPSEDNLPSDQEPPAI